MSAAEACCVGDGSGGHHPFCEHGPRGVEVRGFVGMNGLGELCFFADSRAEGLPLIGSDGRWMGAVVARLYCAIADAPPRRVSHSDLAAIDPPTGHRRPRIVAAD